MELNLKTLQINHENSDKYDYYFNKNIYSNNLKLVNDIDIKNKIPYFYFFQNNHNKYDFVLAGGYLFNVLANYDVLNKYNSDIDIFFYNSHDDAILELSHKFTNYLMREKRDFIYETKFYKNDFAKLMYEEFRIIEVTVKNFYNDKPLKFQFINKKELVSPKEIIDKFNVDYVKMYYDFGADKIYFAEEAYNSITNWKCKFSDRLTLNIKAMNKGMRLYKEKSQIDNKKYHSGIKELGNYNYLCWVGIDYLSSDLINYYHDNFNNMWNLHPQNKSTIIMREQDITAHRYLQSYLNTPDINTVNIKKSSYMFSRENQTKLPKELKQLLDYVNKNFNYEYNQIVVNWYENGNDYLPFHKDWTNDKSKEFNVTTITLCEKGGERKFILQSDETMEKYEFTTKNGLILTLGGMTNTYYKHGIQKENNCGKRISITFRRFENIDEKNEEECDLKILDLKYEEEYSECCSDDKPVKKTQ